MLTSIALIFLLSNVFGTQIPLNVDLEFALFVRPNNSNNANNPLFGRSVLAYSSNKDFKIDLFVGSPYFALQINSTETNGFVSKCSIDLQNSTEIQCNNLIMPNGYYGQPFASNYGATLIGDENHLVACSPSWIENHTVFYDRPIQYGKEDTYFSNKDYFDQLDGKCFQINRHSGKIVNDMSLYIEKPPSKKFVPSLWHSQFGFSAVYNKDDTSYIIGDPSYKLNGIVAIVTSDMVPNKLNHAGSFKNGYTGFSVAYCSRARLIAFGTPRAKNCGLVDLIHSNSLFRKKMTLKCPDDLDFSNMQFGASLLCLDKYLLVGAPLYSESAVKREIGQVYVYEIDRSEPSKRLVSKLIKVGSRFGTTMASIDLNADGVADVVISAPFEPNADGSTGAIYVYYGSKAAGIIFPDEEVRRIGAESLSRNVPQMKSFGYSLWTSTDLDNNGIYDLVIGLPVSSTVTVLRTRPIIKINLIKINSTPISFSNKSYSNPGKWCSKINYCISTSSSTSPDRTYPEGLKFQVSLQVSDSKLGLKEDRIGYHNKSFELTKNSLGVVCPTEQQMFYLEIADKIFDVITPIEVKLNVSIVYPTKRQLFCSWCPVANSVVQNHNVKFEHKCPNKNGVCTSQLHLTVEARYGQTVLHDGISKIIEGEHPFVQYTVKVTNYKDPAINTVLILSIKPHLLNMHNNDRCERKQNYYECDVNRVLNTTKTELFKIAFDLNGVQTNLFNFDLLIKSASNYSNSSKIKYENQIQVQKVPKFEFISEQFANHSFSSQMSTVLFSVSYLIHKQGSSSVKNAYLEIYLPVDVVQLNSSDSFQCHIEQNALSPIAFSLIEDATLLLSCSQTDFCAKYHCNLGQFQSGPQSIEMSLTFAFNSAKIPKQKSSYRNVLLELNADLLVNDALLSSPQIYASFQSRINFNKQQSSALFDVQKWPVIASSGVLSTFLIISLSVVLIKKGFFRRKKLEQIEQIKKRMSMGLSVHQEQIMYVGMEEYEPSGQEFEPNEK